MLWIYVILKTPVLFCIEMHRLSLSQEIKGLREELASRLNSNETLELIREKEEQIRELLEEGESSARPDNIHID